jgi:diacylglycerol kinase family enzyme
VVAGWSLGAAVALLLAAMMLVWRRPQTGPAPTTTLARPSRLAVVLNPTKVPDVADFTGMLTEAALRHGWQLPTFHQTTAEDAGVSMTEAALAEGSDMVLVAGGDGTVRVVCAELARTGVPVGIVPLGTGNLLARNLQLPLRAADAVEVALSGHDRAIDVVEVTGDGLPQTAFTVMAGIGFDAAIMAGASETLKAQLGWRAYVVSGLRNLRYPARRVEVSVDDGPFVRHRARTVIIGNVGLLQAGIPLLPDARFDDGRLDVVVVAPQRTLGWLLIAVRVLRRARHTDDKLARMTGSTVVVRASQPQARQLDGDPIDEGTELRCRVLAGTLLVRVPR